MRQESICDFFTYQNSCFIRQNNLIGLNIRENEEYIVESSEQLTISTIYHFLQRILFDLLYVTVFSRFLYDCGSFYLH